MGRWLAVPMGNSALLLTVARLVHRQVARVRKHSPFGRKPGWAVRPVIVKSGDDCRQELSGDAAHPRLP